MSETAPRAACAPRLEVETSATSGAVRFLSELVQLYLTEALGLPEEASETVRVRLAVVEALTNVVRHGYAGQAPGPLRLRMEREGERLVAVVSDRAPRFDPTEAMRDGRRAMPRPEELRTGGYGLAIIDEVMDDVRYRWTPAAGNELTLGKRLGG